MRCSPTSHTGFCRSGVRKALGMNKAAPSYVSELREELIAAARRRIETRRRRHRVAFRGLAMFAIAIIGMSLFHFTEKPGEAGVLSVTRTDNQISVDLVSTNATSAQIASELERHGIDAD